MDVFIGTIMPVGFNFEPRGWAFCNGQLLPIARYSALFSLLGTMYGGDGQVTFGLPDLRGRVIAGSQGNGPGIQPIAQGQMAGTNSVTVIGTGTVSATVTAANLPAHTHPASMSLSGLTAVTKLAVGSANVGTATPVEGSTVTAATAGQGQANLYLPPSTSQTSPVNVAGFTTTVQGSGTVTVNPNTGGGQPLVAPVQTQAQASVMQPYTGINYIIALEGIFPSRA